MWLVLLVVIPLLCGAGWSSKPPTGTEIIRGDPAGGTGLLVVPLNEGGGTHINDVARGQIGVGTGSAWVWSNGAYGPMLTFNATNSNHFRFENRSNYNSMQTFTVELVIRAASSHVSWIVIKPASDSAHSSPFADWGVLYGFPNSQAVGFWLSNQAGTNSSRGMTASSTPAGTWVHIVVSVDTTQNNVRFFKNGLLETSTDTNSLTIGNQASTDIRVGDNGGGTEAYNGDLAFLAIYQGIAFSPTLAMERYQDTWSEFIEPPDAWGRLAAAVDSAAQFIRRRLAQ